ncbi:MAG: hypothetical protein IAG13_03460 [Deltaproteobacteria bacterium]|nr:hypothetical protein [Nannocystaceae bacterium]
MSAACLLACGKPKTTDTTAPEPTADPTVGPTPTAAPDALPPAEQVLSAAVEAAGGAKAHEALATYYSEARMEMPQQGLSADTKVWWDHGMFFMEVDMPGVGKSRMWSDGKVVTADDPVNGRRTLDGREANQARWATSVSLAREWHDFFETAETIGRREHEGKQLLDVKLASKDGDQLVLSFDQATHLLDSQRFEQQSPMGMLPVEISILEYKEFAGLKHATKSEMKLAIMSATTTVTKFEPNVDIDPTKLTPPPADAPAAVPPEAGKPTKGKPAPKPKPKA